MDINGLNDFLRGSKEPSNFEDAVIDGPETESDTDDKPKPVVVYDKNNRNFDDEISSRLVRLDEMFDDYKRLRDILLANVSQAQEIVQAVGINAFAEIENAEYIAAYTNLTNTINSSLKILTSSYKDIANTLLNLKKLEAPTETNVTNNLNIISTADLIDSLRSSINSKPSN